MELKKAQRKKVKLKLGLSGPTGSGKTYSALRMAFGMIGDWSKIAVIDTENESASLYDNLGDFHVVNLAPPFSPERYIEAIAACEKGGMELVIIDSASHEWSGPGGCVEINEKVAQTRFKGNAWSAWSETTPRHDKFITAMLQSNMHIIACSRSKTETVMGDDKKIKKVGMKEIQREGIGYEYTVSLALDRETHLAIADKDRTGLFEGVDPFLITEETGKKIIDWCNKGVAPEPVKQPAPSVSPTTEQLEEMNAATTEDKLKEVWLRYPELQSNAAWVAHKDSNKQRVLNSK